MIKRTFITGATGFIGARLASRFVEMGIETHLSIRKSSNLWRLQSFHSNVHLHLLDLSDEHSVHQTLNEIKPDYVFHSAAYGGFVEENDPCEILKTNILSTQFLLESCSQLALRKFVYIGSSSEYGLQTQPMIESLAAHPASCYGIGKLAGTHLTQFYAHERNLPATVFRIFSPYGMFDSPKRLIPQVIESSLLNTPLLLGSGKQVRDFIYVEDLIDALMLSLNNTASNGEIINLGSGEQRSVYETVQSLSELLEHPVNPVWNYHRDKNHEPASWVADITKADRILGWKPKTSFANGLHATIVWSKSRR